MDQVAGMLRHHRPDAVIVPFLSLHVDARGQYELLSPRWVSQVTEFRDSLFLSRQGTYRQHHLPFCGSFFTSSFLLIPSDSLNIIPPVRVIRFMVCNVQFPHPSKDMSTIECLVV